eukprot:m.11379 g.11379  ORF g.11379 m.11379 type:complete len:570 (-) comp3828_c0_seq1:193-1902(-)
MNSSSSSCCECGLVRVGEYVVSRICAYLDSLHDLSHLSQTCRVLHSHVRNLPVDMNRPEVVVQFSKFVKRIKTSSSFQENKEETETEADMFHSAVYWCKQGLVFEFVDSDDVLFMFFLLASLQPSQLHSCRIRTHLKGVWMWQHQLGDTLPFGEWWALKYRVQSMLSQLFSLSVQSSFSKIPLDQLIFTHEESESTATIPPIAPRLRCLDVLHLTTPTPLHLPQPGQVFGKLLHRCKLEGLRIVDASPFAHVHTLHLSLCPLLTNVSSLANVHSLQLSHCAELTNVAPLQNVHTLRLVSCSAVTNVQALGSVHTLSLTACQGVEDVRRLGRGVVDLKLNGCDAIKDVSALSSVHTLRILSCLNITNLTCLTHNHHLTVARCGIVSDASCFSNVYDLALKESSFVDVSPLTSVHKLNLSCNTRLTDVSSLGFVHTLILAFCSSIEDVSALSNVHYLDLSFCSKITNVSSLGNCHTLKLSSCVKITDVSTLGSVTSLYLQCCRGVVDVSSLGNVKHLFLNFCNGVTDVSALSALTSLDISNCRHISDISMLGGVLNLKYRQTHIEFFPPNI